MPGFTPLAAFSGGVGVGVGGVGVGGGGWGGARSRSPNGLALRQASPPPDLAPPQPPQPPPPVQPHVAPASSGHDATDVGSRPAAAEGAEAYVPSARVGADGPEAGTTPPGHGGEEGEATATGEVDDEAEKPSSPPLPPVAAAEASAAVVSTPASAIPRSADRGSDDRTGAGETADGGRSGDSSAPSPPSAPAAAPAAAQSLPTGGDPTTATVASSPGTNLTQLGKTPLTAPVQTMDASVVAPAVTDDPGNGSGEVEGDGGIKGGVEGGGGGPSGVGAGGTGSGAAGGGGVGVDPVGLPRVLVDVSFEGQGHNGQAANQLVKDLVDGFPALRPLALLLKQVRASLLYVDRTVFRRMVCFCCWFWDAGGTGRGDTLSGQTNAFPSFRIFTSRFW